MGVRGCSCALRDLFVIAFLTHRRDDVANHHQIGYRKQHKLQTTKGIHRLTNILVDLYWVF